MSWKTWIVLAGVSLAIGCEQRASSPAPEKVPLSSPVHQRDNQSHPGGESAPTTTPLDDRSLTSEEYVKLGLPKCDRPWSSADQSGAAKVLREIAKRDPRELPRFKSAKSGVVFARITSDENLDSLRKKMWPVSVRSGFALQFLHATTSIGALYGAAAIENRETNDETTELLGQSLRIAVILKELSDEALSNLDPNDASFSARAKAVKELTAGLGPVLQGVMTQALASKKLKPETRTRLLKYLDKTLPEIVKALPTKTRQDLLAKLKTLSERPEFAEHQQDFEPLLEKISLTLEESTPNEPDRPK